MKRILKWLWYPLITIGLGFVCKLTVELFLIGWRILK